MTDLIETRCVGCGKPVMESPRSSVQPMCIECRKLAAGNDWPSAVKIGEWHPSTGYPSIGAGPASAQEAAIERTGTRWRWGCLLCGETGEADGPDQALRLESTHRGFACPKAPGLSTFERKRREAWAKVRRETYVE
jgi:endogenous inhibitor of DNA gyrase (YacG/DUF329 family)